MKWGERNVAKGGRMRENVIIGIEVKSEKVRIRMPHSKGTKCETSIIAKVVI